MKLYDFDAMFDDKLASYIKDYGDKYKESEWEDVIPKMYQKFGDTKLKLIGKTPRQYYAEMDDEMLVKTLKAHIKQGVAVSEFLCDAIEDRESCVDLLLPLLDGGEDEITYAMNILGARDEAIPKYMEIMLSSESEDLKDACADYIKLKADSVKDDVLSHYKNGTEKELMLEILSRVEEKDEEVFNILLTAFRTDIENLPMHASFLASYGDDRALPYLMDKIDEEGISYIEFQELKYAIEALGGTYEKDRDFSADPYFQIIKNESEKDPAIFDDPDAK